MDKQIFDAYFPTTGETRRVKFNPAHMKQAAILILDSTKMSMVCIKRAGKNETLLICIFVPDGNNDGHYHFYTEEETV